jgi:hypothetical protein
MELPTNGKTCECPHCGNPLSMEITSRLMNTSRVSFEMKPHKGELLQASTVGKSLASMEALYVAVGKELGVKVVATVEGVTFSEGAVKFDLLLTRHEPGIRKREKAA